MLSVCVCMSEGHKLAPLEKKNPPHVKESLTQCVLCTRGGVV